MKEKFSIDVVVRLKATVNLKVEAPYSIDANIEARDLAEKMIRNRLRLEGFDFRIDDSYVHLCLRGWELFKCRGVEIICKDDEAGIFETDEEAVEHVRKLAAAGFTYAKEALEIHEKNWPIYLEYAGMDEV